MSAHLAVAYAARERADDLAKQAATLEWGAAKLSLEARAMRAVADDHPNVCVDYRVRELEDQAATLRGNAQRLRDEAQLQRAVATWATQVGDA